MIAFFMGVIVGAVALFVLAMCGNDGGPYDK
jgi:hypothetical protein